MQLDANLDPYVLEAANPTLLHDTYTEASRTIVASGGRPPGRHVGLAGDGAVEVRHDPMPL